MRNPILPSPNRPIPLPDCILMDAWWTDRRDVLRERSGSVLRYVLLVVGAIVFLTPFYLLVRNALSTDSIA